MEFNINKNKRMSIVFGIIEYSNIYFLIKTLIGLIKTFSANSVLETTITIMLLMEIVLIISILISGTLYFFNKIAAYYIYFGQIILRLVFALPSFGILLKLNYFFKNQTLYKTFFVLCMILEALRLVATIYIIIKSKASNASEK